jgi:hypothetical protein
VGTGEGGFVAVDGDGEAFPEGGVADGCHDAVWSCVWFGHLGARKRDGECGFG